ncbi:hypothetical protein TNCT_631821 [Trichonephila clavata]|uniref:Uncharacterized protein n=1 Tax=Trichonephila clavata TaxID=2740835 RepID=A0A8X6H993_TRICU|nr:hypothetical protein TNCT_631821 [Trichonephila clavata]
MWKGICRKEHDTKCSSDNRARSRYPPTDCIHPKSRQGGLQKALQAGALFQQRYSGAKSRSAKQNQEKKPDRSRCTTEFERSMSDHKGRARISPPQECQKGGEICSHKISSEEPHCDRAHARMKV